MQKRRGWTWSLGIHAVGVAVLAMVVVLELPAEDEEVHLIVPIRAYDQVMMENPRDLYPNRKILDMNRDEDPVFRRDTGEEEEFENERNNEDVSEFLSDKQFRGQGTYEVAGGGAGAGGIRGVRGFRQRMLVYASG